MRQRMWVLDHYEKCVCSLARIKDQHSLLRKRAKTFFVLQVKTSFL